MCSPILKTSERVMQILYRFYPMFRNFPKSETHGITVEIKRKLSDIASNLFLAERVRHKRVEYLQSAEGHLMHFIVTLKLIENRNYISKGFYADIDTTLTDIIEEIDVHIRNTAAASKARKYSNQLKAQAERKAQANKKTTST